MSLPTVRIIFIAEPPLTTAIFMTYFLRNSYGGMEKLGKLTELKILRFGLSVRIRLPLLKVDMQVVKAGRL